MVDPINVNALFMFINHVHFLPKPGKASNYPVGLLTIKSGFLSIIKSGLLSIIKSGLLSIKSGLLSIKSGLL